jgi:alkanesulfonate monooxygenase SsuD/methylene tetrahydromethanopterin reductase-like flavin-dependent oxidoreductase (luciferase family)
MRLSLWPNAQQPWPELLEEVRHAEATGWDAVYVADHFMGDGASFGAPDTPNLEAMALVAALGASTERVRVGPLVLGNTYRHPAVVANWAATVDRLTGGRLVLGVGAGWQQNEHDQYGIELPAPGERLDRFEEACRVLHALLREPVADLVGQHYVLSEARCEPKPVQNPLPLLIGGKGNRMLGIVARHADAWNMWGLPELIAARSQVLERHCERIDRDPATIWRSTQALVMVTDDRARADAFRDAVAPRAAYAGPAEGFAELVERWRAVGVDEVVVPDGALGTGSARLERLDALRAAVR